MRNSTLNPEPQASACCFFSVTSSIYSQKIYDVLNKYEAIKVKIILHSINIQHRQNNETCVDFFFFFLRLGFPTNIQITTISINTQPGRFILFQTHQHSMASTFTFFHETILQLDSFKSSARYNCWHVSGGVKADVQPFL